MTAESKPSEGARKYAREVLELVLTSTNQGRLATDAEVDAVAVDIDREAVAPAVRDLVSTLAEIEPYMESRADADWDGDGYVGNEEMRFLNEIQDHLARYRHLIEGEGE